MTTTPHPSRPSLARPAAFLLLLLTALARPAAANGPGASPAYDPANTPPAGFTALFNGHDLANWQGLAGDPPALAKLSPDDRADAQSKADNDMHAHWRAENGVLIFDGKGQSLQTTASYKDFELFVDWKIEKGGDSGIYLRGSPQVQIWDNPLGSGGLYNNEKNPARPLVVADAPVGEWNRFHIIMKGPRVTVYLNNQLVVDNTILENYWDREKPIAEAGPIELQNHGNTLYFKNIFVRDLSPAAKSPEETARDARMAWWREARFGLFIHWGLYAIPAGVWDGRPVNGVGEWIMDTAKIPPNVYEKLAAGFDPRWFDAKEWARLAKDAGMKYVVITTKHHDGFCLFDSQHTTYDIMEATPFKRDIMKELSDAVRAEDLKMGWYHSIMDWHHPDATGPAFAKYEPVLRAQVQELLTNYGPIGVMWFDGEWINEWTTDRGRRLEQLCRQLQPDTIVNNRVGKGRQGMQGMNSEGDHPGDFGTPEQEVPETGLPGVDWESCMTMNDTWGYKTADNNWKSTQTLIQTLCDIASKGGNFLLNVGPAPDGLIPEPSVLRLREIGAWLKTNGEAIYGTSPSPFAELDWGRCTTKPSKIYLHVFRKPDSGRLALPGLMSPISRVRIVEGNELAPSVIEHDARGAAIRLPAWDHFDRNSLPIVLELTIAGDAAVVPPPPPQPIVDPEGTLILKAADAQIIGPAHGATAKYEEGADRDCIGFWTTADDAVTWKTSITRPGSYLVVAEYACAAGREGSVVRFTIADQPLDLTVESTKGWSRFRRADLGLVRLDEAAEIEIRVKPEAIPNEAALNLRSVRLIPVQQ